MLEDWMDCALKLAEEALQAGEVPVGCVFIHQGAVIAQSRNSVNETRNATRHAEMNCVDQVLEWCRHTKQDYRSVFAATEVVVTVEPCIMCTPALHNLHVAHITYGCRNDRFGGCGSVFDASSLFPDPCPVISGVRADEAMQLLKDFYKGTNPNAPVSKVKKGRKPPLPDVTGRN
uniref:CMP/dCMP-type deaminase domain-containing protein n=1 Tax=Timema cristinae TaxID=61476 RepID=A0A7R9DC20_TIMCR|nr:unnamed protein product [Timema cristinae]